MISPKAAPLIAVSAMIIGILIGFLLVSNSKPQEASIEESSHQNRSRTKDNSTSSHLAEAVSPDIAAHGESTQSQEASSASPPQPGVAKQDGDAPDFPPVRTSQVKVLVSGKLHSWSLPSAELGWVLAWKSGDVEVSTQQPLLRLTITEVLDGNLYDPDFMRRPEEFRYVDVLLINDAAELHQLPNTQSMAGEWTLTVLPNGRYMVEDLADTPVTKSLAAVRKENIQKWTTTLASQDPSEVVSAMNELFGQRHCYRYIPELLQFLDDKKPIDLPARQVGRRTIPAQRTTLANEALDYLKTLVWALPSTVRPSMGMTKQDWQAWWKDLLSRRPFPKISTVPGNIVELKTWKANEWYFGLEASPYGDRMVQAIGRRVSNVNSNQGICQWLHSDPDRYAMLYTNGGPRGMSVAWKPDAMCAVWQEGMTGITAVTHKLLLARSGQQSVIHDIGSLKAKYWAIGTFGEGWILGYADQSLALHAQKLAPDGLPLGDPVILKIKEVLSPHHADTARVMQWTESTDGSALAIRTRSGIYLVLVDRDLKQVSEQLGSYSGTNQDPQITFNNGHFLLAWEMSGFREGYLAIRVFDAALKPTTQPVPIARMVNAIARPIPYKSGFALAWVDSEWAPTLARFALIDTDGKSSQQACVYSGRLAREMTLSIRDQSAVICLRDESGGPERLISKEFKIDEVERGGVESEEPLRFAPATQGAAEKPAKPPAEDF